MLINQKENIKNTHKYTQLKANIFVTIFSKDYAIQNTYSLSKKSFHRSKKKKCKM